MQMLANDLVKDRSTLTTAKPASFIEVIAIICSKLDLCHEGIKGNGTLRESC